MLKVKFIEVTHDEYVAFIKNWPNKLEFNCAGIFEPPLGSYNDFSNGKVWPESIVAKEVREWLGPNNIKDFSEPGKFWRYYILNQGDCDA